MMLVACCGGGLLHKGMADNESAGINRFLDIWNGWM